MEDVLLYLAVGAGSYLVARPKAQASALPPAAKPPEVRPPEVRPPEVRPPAVYGTPERPELMAQAEANAAAREREKRPRDQPPGPPKTPVPPSLTTRDASLAIEKTRPLRERIIKSALAEADAKVLETANNNRGERVEIYQKSVNLGGGDAWCAAFVCWNVMRGLGLTRVPGWCGGSTSWLMARARDAYRSGKLAGDYVVFARDIRKNPALRSRVKPGWVWVRGTARNGADALEAGGGGWSKGHTGLFLSDGGRKPNQFSCVEGNTWTGASGKEGVYIVRNHDWDAPANVIFFDPVALSEAYGYKIPPPDVA